MNRSAFLNLRARFENPFHWRRRQEAEISKGFCMDRTQNQSLLSSAPSILPALSLFLSVTCWLLNGTEPALAAKSVTVTRAELKEEQRWLEQNLLSGQARTAFSFKYDQT